MMRFIRDIKIGTKGFFLKLFTSLSFSIRIFIYSNISFATIYISFPTISDGVKYNWIEFIIHTFISSLTLSIPVFIKFPTKGLLLDFIVLAHVFVAYLFLGILISMIYRKVTRT